MRLLAIDPGPEQSAALTYDTDKAQPIAWMKCANDVVRNLITSADDVDHLAIEGLASYGMPVGAEVFETAYWIGGFIERWLFGRPYSPRPRLIYRKDVKLHICGNTRAKDANVRQALIDRYGPGKERAVGLKKSPGPLYGLTSDCWSALAVAITAAETEATP